MRSLPLLLGLALATPAHASLTRYTIDWTAAESGGDTHNGVTIKLTLLGDAWMYSNPAGPVLGNRGAADDIRVAFDTDIEKFCVHAAGQDSGETVTITTNRSSGDVVSVVNTGSHPSTVSGNVVSFAGSPSTFAGETHRVCVENPAGFDEILFDHNGAGSGLLFNRGIYMDGSACTAVTWYADTDEDGYGDPASTVTACAAPAGYVDVDTDCDDGDPDAYPGAVEVVGDEVDQSCDGEEICFIDADGDGYRTAMTQTSWDEDCQDGSEAAASLPDGDCDDHADTTWPGALEIAYDGIDQDCSGQDLCDVDGDGVDAGVGACSGTDCADDDPAISPLAAEIWYDGVDQDCDGWSDDDADLDGFDDVDAGGDDCDDADPDRRPDAAEIPYDGIDQNCDPADDDDVDGDGFDAVAAGGTDCLDTDEAVFPGAVERENGFDDDCDGIADGEDLDADGVEDRMEVAWGLDRTTVDSDGDGATDREELGDVTAPLDTDGDGIIDALDPDDDEDGLATRDELGVPRQRWDSDGDGWPDHRDRDSDNDGWDDAQEGLGDHDHDGLHDAVDPDADQDGVPDREEAVGDSDGDGAPDRLDADDDGDGLATAQERGWAPDPDGDGIPNHLDQDLDGDGTPDAEEGLGDVDCDDTPDVLDADDGDGPCLNPPVATFQSGACTTAPAPTGLLAVLLGLLAVRRRRG
jgi:hypothetical protein